MGKEGSGMKGTDGEARAEGTGGGGEGIKERKEWIHTYIYSFNNHV